MKEILSKEQRETILDKYNKTTEWLKTELAAKKEQIARQRMELEDILPQ